MSKVVARVSFRGFFFLSGWWTVRLLMALFDLEMYSVRLHD